MSCSIDAPTSAETAGEPRSLRFDASERADALRCIGTPRHKTSMCQWTMLWPRSIECTHTERPTGALGVCVARDAPWFDYKSLHMRCDERTNQWYVEFSTRRALFSLLPSLIVILVLFFVIFGLILARMLLWQGKVKKSV